MLQISREWTPEERLKVIGMLAAIIEQRKDTVRNEQYAFVIRCLANEPAIMLEANRESIERCLYAFHRLFQTELGMAKQGIETT